MNRAIETAILTEIAHNQERMRCPMRYEFRIDGMMSDEARSVFADMRITELPRQTLIEGEVLDESHLRGVIAQLDALGLKLISALPDAAEG
jgi:hypothetical protein